MLRLSTDLCFFVYLSQHSYLGITQRLTTVLMRAFNGCNLMQSKRHIVGGGDMLAAVIYLPLHIEVIRVLYVTHELYHFWFWVSYWPTYLHTWQFFVVPDITFAHFQKLRQLLGWKKFLIEWCDCFCQFFSNHSRFFSFHLCEWLCGTYPFLNIVSQIHIFAIALVRRRLNCNLPSKAISPPARYLKTEYFRWLHIFVKPLRLS